MLAGAIKSRCLSFSLQCGLGEGGPAEGGEKETHLDSLFSQVRGRDKALKTMAKGHCSETFPLRVLDCNSCVAFLSHRHLTASPFSTSGVSQCLE